jgi:hypothetical protein
MAARGGVGGACQVRAAFGPVETRTDERAPGPYVSADLGGRVTVVVLGVLHLSRLDPFPPRLVHKSVHKTGS